MAKNSIVIICKNIKIDRNYQNCLTYSETEMYQLCYENKINMSNTFSFIRENENTLRVPFTYQECLSSNYMAFQNPRYSNKWFFAFIDSVEYVSDGATNINFTVDEFSTWWSYWNPVETFVIREHTNDDTIGSNLVDEGLGLGDYICQHVNNNLKPFNSFKPVLGVSECLDNNETTANIPEFYENGGIFNGICYIIGEASPYATSHIVRGYDACGKASSIQYIFMAPTEIIESYEIGYVAPLTGYDFPISYGFIENPTSSYYFPGYGATFGSINDPHFYRPLAIGNYIPENKKLLTNPYCYLMVDPHDGSSYKFNYEDFNDVFYSFAVYGVLTPGCSVKFVPLNYKGVAENYSYAFSGAKFPMCSWNSDAYTNWLTQNGVNLGFTTLNQNEAMSLGGFGSMLAGGLLMATGIGGMMGAGLIATGATGIFSSMQSDYKASMLPDQVKGNQNTGDVNYSLNLINPTCYEMTIKEEKAKSIDEYFTRFGYKTNRLKVPNQIGRRYFNYVEIGKGEVIGYPKTTAGIPADSMEKINNIYRGGVTLWHDHSRIGNYAGNIITDPTPPTPPSPSPETTVIDTNIVANDVNINKTNYINLLGNTTQNGTPTPTAPIDVKVVTDNILVQISNSNNSLQTIHPVNLRDLELCKIGDYQDIILKSTGKNLMPDTQTSQTINGVTLTNKGGCYKISGTATAQVIFQINPLLSDLGLVNGNSYTYSSNQTLPTGVTSRLEIYNNTSWKRVFISDLNTSNQYRTATLNTTDGNILRQSIIIANGTTVNIDNLGLMLETGTQKTDYEPYGTGWYIKENIGKVVLNGTEANWYTSTGTTQVISNKAIGYIQDTTKLPCNLSSNCQMSNNNIYFYNTGLSLTDFKTLLGITNAIVYGRLATPNYRVITDTELSTQLDQLYTAGLFSGTTRIVSYTNGANPYIKLHYNI